VQPASSTEINRLLADRGHGDRAARDALIPLIYNECAAWRAAILGVSVPITSCRVPR